MTKKQFEKKVRALLQGVAQEALRKSLRLYSCGGVDPEKYGDDFALPRICLTVALRNAAQDICPMSPEYKKEIKNLEHF